MGVLSRRCADGKRGKAGVSHTCSQEVVVEISPRVQGLLTAAKWPYNNGRYPELEGAHIVMHWVAQSTRTDGRTDRNRVNTGATPPRGVSAENLAL